MAKIPFDIKFRPQIESGEYKVETNDHHPVRIICWNKNTGGLDRIVALVAGESGQEKTLHYTEEGRCVATGSNRNKDLFLVTPGPELTELEQAVKDLCWKVGIMGEVFYKDDIIKKTAAELLELARKELLEEQYTSDPRKTDLYKLGKEEALKDLPKWRKCGFPMGTDNPFPRYLVRTGGAHYSLTNTILKCDEYIPLSELAKLPKFKED